MKSRTADCSAAGLPGLPWHWLTWAVLMPDYLGWRTGHKVEFVAVVSDELNHIV